MPIKIGDSVCVRAGVIDPDLSVDIGGWQGRIREVDGADTVYIEWDSITMRQMSIDLIIRCENENLDWRFMTLEQCDLKIVESRDTEDNVATTASRIWIKAMDDPRFNAGE